MSKNIIYIAVIVSIIALVTSGYTLITLQNNITELEGTVDEIKTTLNSIQKQIDDTQDSDEFKPVTLVDSMGNIAVITQRPERIVSLAPSNTEIVYAIGAGDRLVGVTDFCNYPYNFTEWIKTGNITSIGNYYGPSTEPIVALEPDLILASTGSLEAAQNLRALGFSVLVVESKAIEGVLQDILLVGQATGNNAQAGNLVSTMRVRIDNIIEKVETSPTTPKVYHEVWNDPLMSVGPGTFIDELITWAGGQNIFNDATTSWPTVSAEAVIQKDPDVMIFPDMYMGRAIFTETIEAIKNRPGWHIITAIQNDAIYEIDSDIISRSGPRLVDALEQIAEMSHPDLFK